MKLLDTYPLVTTDRCEACRDFYVRHFGFEVGFDSSSFVYLHRPAGSPGEAASSLAFLSVEHPSTPPGPEPFGGRGVLITFQVDDAAAAEQELREAGVRIAYPARREPWGQIRLQILDPAGMAVDIVEQVEPEPGYWERYSA